ncbi:MAG: polysaccharide deacetylase family protein, partial [Deltaproteobacteria bacterium]
MDFHQTQESAFISSARAVYRKARSTKNGLLNYVDPPVVILIYHRVTELPSDPEMLAVSPLNFRRQMEFLKRHFCIVRFEEDWSDLGGPAVAVTFDDGYADNLLEALPVLEEVGVPATFFVSTGRIGTGREFWWHRLEAVLLREGEFPPYFQLNDARFGRSWETDSPEQRRMLYARLVQLMREVGPERQEDWLNQLAGWAGQSHTEQDIHRCLTREELQRLAESPWATIGAHTVTHSALSALSEEKQRTEIFHSKQELERITGKAIRTFSYPFGR